MCMHQIQSYEVYVKQKLTELTGETDKSTITVGDLNTPLSTPERTRQKVSKHKEEQKHSKPTRSG